MWDPNAEDNDLYEEQQRQRREALREDDFDRPNPTADDMANAAWWADRLKEARE